MTRNGEASAPPVDADDVAATLVQANGSAAPLTDEELHAWRGLLATYSCVAKRLDSELEQAHGMQLTAYEVLSRLDDATDGRMRMCDLASSIGLSRSGLTRLVDRLERDGLLSRCSCSHDARGAYACLTDEGCHQLEHARETHLAAVRQHFLSRFTGEELNQLAEMWARVRPTDGCCG